MIAPAQDLQFSCGPQGAFPPTLIQQDLVESFGSRNVMESAIDVGEGETEPGTILFLDSQTDRIEILWKDGDTHRSPRSVRLAIGTSNASRWKGPLGIPTQIRLQELEALNWQPFRIVGFGWDYSGTVLSWSGGEIEKANGSACRFIVRLNPAPADRDRFEQEY